MGQCRDKQCCTSTQSQMLQRQCRDHHRNAPKDMVLRHYCLRTYKNKKGMQKKSKEPTAAYFHLKLDCARRIVPDMEISDIVIHDEIMAHLSPGHKDVLTKFGLL